ncbi:hypothetical protein Tco_1194286 [Tanacetum coccineum]
MFKKKILADSFFDDIADKDVLLLLILEKKSDETEEVNIEEKGASNVKLWRKKQKNWVWIPTHSTVDKIWSSVEQLKAAEVLVSILDKSLSISGPLQTQLNSNSRIKMNGNHKMEGFMNLQGAYTRDRRWHYDYIWLKEDSSIKRANNTPLTPYSFFVIRLLDHGMVFNSEDESETALL